MRLRYTFLLVCLSVLPATAQDFAGGYKQAPFNTHNYTAGHQKAQTLPSKYDSRDYGYITTARNQAVSGPCWAFATCDVTEALSNKEGFEDGHHAPQLLTNCHDGFLWTKAQGGNSEMATALLARLGGQAYEDSIPYAATVTDCPEHTAADFAAYFLESYSLPAGDTTAIKECIYEYGAVSAAMHYDSKYYDSKTNTYKYTGEELSNHGISIVGWDDEDRVFIVKFNYGSKRFDNGFIKVSYDDTKIMNECYSFHSRVETSEIDTVYYYDRTGMTSWMEYPDPTKVSKVSALSYYNAKEKQKVKYVGTYVIKPCTITFYVQIGDDIYSKEVICPYAGYYTAKIDEEPEVEGQFIVAVDYPDFLPIEYGYENYNEPQLATCAEQPQQIQYNDDPNQTFSVGTDAPQESFRDFNLCVKAYTQKVGEPTTADETEECYAAPVIDGHIDNAIWDSAAEIGIYTLDGTLIEDLTSHKDINREGLFIFVVRYSSGVTKRSLQLLY